VSRIVAPGLAAEGWANLMLGSGGGRKVLTLKTIPPFSGPPLAVP
jgi:hypothetical protein